MRSQVAANPPDQRGEGPPLPAQPALDPRAQRRGEERRLARSRDRDHDRIAPNYGRSDETALRWTVDDVDQDAGAFALVPGEAIDGGIIGGVDHESSPGEHPRPVIRGCNGAHLCPRLAQTGRLLPRQLPIAEHHARLAAEVQKDRVVPHAVASWRAASSRTRATSGRVNSAGRSRPSSSSLRTAVPL